MLDSTVEGAQILSTLRKSKTVFEIVIKSKYGSINLGTNKAGQVVWGQDGNATIALNPTSMTKSVTFLNTGIENVDADPYRTVWHELYHPVDRSRIGPDPYKFGTVSPQDSYTVDGMQINVPKAHEKRATRFENIISGRLGGKTILDTYGDGRSRIGVPQPLGVGPDAKGLMNQMNKR